MRFGGPRVGVVKRARAKVWVGAPIRSGGRSARSAEHMRRNIDPYGRFRCRADRLLDTAIAQRRTGVGGDPQSGMRGCTIHQNGSMYFQVAFNRGSHAGIDAPLVGAVLFRIGSAQYDPPRILDLLERRSDLQRREIFEADRTKRQHSNHETVPSPDGTFEITPARSIFGFTDETQTCVDEDFGEDEAIGLGARLHYECQVLLDFTKPSEVQ